jgi:hydrogenase maturation protease
MKVVVIGIGNILFCDEGVGVYAGRYLEENYDFEPKIEIVDGGTLGFGLMDYYQTYDKVVVLDTISIDDTPGAVYNVPSSELMELGEYRNTAHEVEVVEMLEICSLLGKIAEVNVIGIVPEDIVTVGIGLSERLHAHFPALVEAAAKELVRSGITVVAKEGGKPLDAVIRTYSESTCIHEASQQNS